MLVGQIISWVIAVPILTSMQPATVGADAGCAHDGDLAHAGAVHRRRHHRRRRDLYASQAREAGGRRTGQHARRISRRATLADDRDRDISPPWIYRADRRLPCHRGVAVVHVREVDGARAERVDADAGRRSIRADRRLRNRRSLRLHGGTHRCVEQSDLGRRHSVDRDLCVAGRTRRHHRRADTRHALVAFALFVTAIVFACATISNDNLQDLKTGQLVGASPMRQQIALIVGVAAGASVIPFVLNLLAKAYGFAGAPNVNVIAANPLPAPQATLICSARAGCDRRTVSNGRCSVSARSSASA